jgi:hypothetical protein
MHTIDQDRLSAKYARYSNALKRNWVLWQIFLLALLWDHEWKRAITDYGIFRGFLTLVRLFPLFRVWQHDSFHKKKDTAPKTGYTWSAENLSCVLDIAWTRRTCTFICLSFYGWRKRSSYACFWLSLLPRYSRKAYTNLSCMRKKPCNIWIPNRTHVWKTWPFPRACSGVFPLQGTQIRTLIRWHQIKIP